MELIYLDHVEWYLGERVLRQFGIGQPVPDPPPRSFHASRTGGAARYSLLDTFRDQIRHFNAGGDFFEMHLTDRVLCVMDGISPTGALYSRSMNSSQDEIGGSKVEGKQLCLVS